MTYLQGMYWFRRIHLLSLIGSIGFVGVLSLSDRAPGLVNALIRTGFVLAVRIDPFGTAGVATRAVVEAGRSAPSGADTIGHFVMWAAVGFVATGLASTIRDRLSMLSALFLLSALFEAGQQYFSWSRQASLDDLVANGIGLLFGYLCFTMAETVVIPRLGHVADLGRRLGFSGPCGGGSLR